MVLDAEMHVPLGDGPMIHCLKYILVVNLKQNIPFLSVRPSSLIIWRIAIEYLAAIGATPHTTSIADRVTIGFLVANNHVAMLLIKNNSSTY